VLNWVGDFVVVRLLVAAFFLVRVLVPVDGGFVLVGVGVVDFAYAKYNGQVSDSSVIREALNNVIFRRSDTRALSDA
jgi:hypothetical protein